MWQAIVDESGRVITVNNWEHPVGIPCQPDTPIGYVWTGSAFVEHPDDTAKRYDAALTAHFDAKAQERRYDNRLTCALRAGFPGPFQAEGLAFAQWMDNCNAYAYTVMGQVLGGLRPMPTVEAFIEEMPDLIWPV